MGKNCLVVVGLTWLVSIASVAADDSPPKVRKIANVPYYRGPGADERMHRLDLYLPANGSGFPTILYVHGGAWSIGDKNQFGVPDRIGRSFAKRGIGFVSINYRLSPKVRHPEHVRDVARALKWVRENIAGYGGCKDEIFLAGHSAGAHLVALLATNERYLREQGLSLADIRGVVPISGPYWIPRKKVFFSVLGKDENNFRDASPVFHCRSNCPPFLLICADSDLPYCGRDSATKLCEALRKKGVSATTYVVPNRNHITVLWSAVSDEDVVNRRIYEFVLGNVTLHRLLSASRWDP